MTGIEWDGQPDNIVTIDTPVKTSWVKFTIDPDNAYNNPSGAECGLAEFGVVEVQKSKAIVDFKPVAVDTTIGEIPTLPAQTEAVYSDGTTGAVDVTWDPITSDMVAKGGWFTIHGGSGTQVKATVAVNVVER